MQINNGVLPYNGCFLKFGVKVGVEESIVNALSLHGQRSQSTLKHSHINVNTVKYRVIHERLPMKISLYASETNRYNFQKFLDS
jgi:hypothetical protein